MFARFTRTLIALIATIVAYQLYALGVAPLFEPKLVAQAAPSFEQTDIDGGIGKYQAVLATCFPPGHWCLSGKPKIIESGTTMLVLEDYKRDDRGRLDLSRCAIVMFSKPRAEGEPIPRNAVVLEAPGGARLQFDSNLNFTQGKIGRPVAGMFPGEITIRSDMREPGPQDDLLITTRDLQLNDLLLVTDADVDIRLGANRGHGRRLEMKLLRESTPSSPTSGLAVAGVEWLEILEDVRVELELGKLNPLRDEARDKVVNAEANRSIYLTAAHEPLTGPQLDINAAPPITDRQSPSSSSEPPVQITCSGAFRFDLLKFLVAFQQDVRVSQLNLQGQSDQLTCRELRLHLGDEQGDAADLSPEEDVELGRRQRAVLSKLRPYLLEAVGDPVRIDSPARGAMVRGVKLEFRIPDRTFNVEGSPAQMVYGPNEIQAPRIRYRHPLPTENIAVGELWMAGPGWLRAVPKETEPDRWIEARWQAAPQRKHAVELTRVAGKPPTLIIHAAPEVTASKVGRIRAEKMRIQLADLPSDGPEGPAIELSRGPNAPAILPERIDALGRVQIASRELNGETEELVATFNVVEGAQPQGANPQAGGIASTIALPLGEPNVAAQAPQADGPPKQVYAIRSPKMMLEVGYFGRRTKPMALECVGGVQFRETKPNAMEPSAPGDEPLVVTGDKLRVEDIHLEAVRIDVSGSDAPSAGEAARAAITARGMRMWAKQLHVDQAKNRLWSDGPGNAHLRTKQALLGQSDPAGVDVHLRWKEGLVFDGLRLRLKGDVFAEATNDWLHCREMVAKLNQRVVFGESSGGQKIDIAQVDCDGGVTIDHVTMDTEGRTSHEHGQLQTLSINQITGLIQGDGPGTVRSVRLSNGSPTLAFANLNKDPSAAPADNTGPRLQFLRVNFQRGVAGNLHQKILSFEERVQAVHGPILAWEQELPVLRPEGPLPDTAVLTCRQLTVLEDPAGRYAAPAGALLGSKLGPLELQARGEVRIEGATKQNTTFVAETAVASYTQMKKIFMLEGDGVLDSKLWITRKPGEPPQTMVAQKLSYNLETEEARVEGIRNVDVTNPSTAPAAIRPPGAGGGIR
jgi:hypothetical protein